MDQKVITIDIFGDNSEIVASQKKIISSIPDTSSRTQVYPDLLSYLKKMDSLAEIVVINLSGQALYDLECLENAHVTGKSIVAIGNSSDVNLLAVAINAGVAQFIDAADYQNQLLKAVNKILLTRLARGAESKKRKLNVIINAKGGSGASVIASNVAYQLSQFRDQSVALLDLDMQFGTIGLNFDVAPKYTVSEALKTIAEIDPISLEAYLVKYFDNLKLLLPSVDEVVLPGEIEPQAVKQLLNVLQRRYNQIVIDLPRLIDPLSTMVMEQADHIIIVVQQTFAQYRDGRRMIHILNKDLDIPLEKITVVINRYDPKASLRKSDMVNLLNHDFVFTIENDFERVAAASNLGQPLCSSAPNSKIAKDIKKLAMYLGELSDTNKKQGILGQIKSIFS